jgi:ribokinase
MQLEIPLATVEYVAVKSAGYGVPVILNPAPARVLSDELLSMVMVLTPNQKEAEMLSGVAIVDKSSAERAAAVLAGKDSKTIIITLGADGAFVLDDGEFLWVPAPVVTAVDTTAAGDVFSGALAVALSEGRSMKDAVGFACAAAALSVTRMGAQSSAPTRGEVDGFRDRR